MKNPPQNKKKPTATTSKKPQTKNKHEKNHPLRSCKFTRVLGKKSLEIQTSMQPRLLNKVRVFNIARKRLIHVRGDAGDLCKICRKSPAHCMSSCFIVQKKVFGIQLNCWAQSCRETQVHFLQL